jgi:hypothetical protein
MALGFTTVEKHLRGLGEPACDIEAAGRSSPVSICSKKSSAWQNDPSIDSAGDRWGAEGGAKRARSWKIGCRSRPASDGVTFDERIPDRAKGVIVHPQAKRKRRPLNRD